MPETPYPPMRLLWRTLTLTAAVAVVLVAAVVAVVAVKATGLTVVISGSDQRVIVTDRTAKAKTAEPSGGPSIWRDHQPSAGPSIWHRDQP